jgi:hypothetical protein
MDKDGLGRIMMMLNKASNVETIKYDDMERNDILKIIRECMTEEHYLNAVHNALNDNGSQNLWNSDYINWDQLKSILDIRFNVYVEKDKLSDSVYSINFLVERIHNLLTNSGYTQSFSDTDNISGMTYSTTYNKNTSINKNMDTKKLRNIEYVIGIDLGHGETSAAICPINWDSQANQMEPVKDLDMGSNRKVIPSAIAINNSDEAFIGESAFKPEHLNNSHLYVCFKKKPENIEGENEKIMIRFMKEVYRYIKETNSSILTDGNHVVVIATPSGWDKTAQDLYKQMAMKAGIPIGSVTQESRAALVKAQHDSTSGLDRCISKGAVVFDMGSSTLDFTFLNQNSSNKPIDYGYDCGASYVEKLMLSILKKNEPLIGKFETKHKEMAPVLLYKAREVKESVYFDPTSKVKKFVNFEELVDDDEFEDERYKMVYNPGELNELLENDGYFNKIRNAMIDFHTNHIKGATIYGVLLTGGASRMDFIKKLVCECWNIDESQVYRDQDPSLTISQGVAEVARVDLLTNGMDTDLEKDINTLINNDDIYNLFVENYGNSLFSSVVDTVNDTLTDFANSETDYCISDLKIKFSNRISDVITSSSKEVPKYIEDSILAASKDIREKVDNIISYYSTQNNQLKAPEIKVMDVNINGINLNSVINDISKKVIDESSDWTGAIAGGVIGGAIALILGGPLAWMIGGAALIGKYIFGTDSEAQKRRKAMKKALNHDERIEVYNQIVDKGEEITQNIETSIRNSLNGDDVIKNAVKELTKNVLTSYKKNLSNARIIID